MCRIFVVNLTHGDGKQSVHCFDNEGAAREYARKHKNLGLTVHEWEL